LFERPDRGERAILVFTQQGIRQTGNNAEFVELARSAGATVVCNVRAVRQRPHPRYYIGTGKARELAEQVAQNTVDIVLVDRSLSPAQERNLERILKCRVLDRTALILDIFAQRARTHEGKLQVELAQLQHLATRLVRGWSHLERQQGGIGLRGPGEKQLELDRRLLGLRIKQIRRRLQKVRRQRAQGRAARRKAELPTVALVGYTNAGKSTLFNALTDAAVLSEDKLFATLDPTLRRVTLDNGQAVVLADTVGFISDLPHTLVDAFRATLEEVCEADLLLHVVDAADEDREVRSGDVMRVLQEIGAEEVPQLLVMNKIDLCNVRPTLEMDEGGAPTRVWLSAHTGSGLALLKNALTQRCAQERLRGCLKLSSGDARLRSWLHNHGAVLAEEFGNDGEWLLRLDIDAATWHTLARRGGVQPQALVPERRDDLATPTEAKYNDRWC
jgi:GTP-binding protein HflX